MSCINGFPIDITNNPKGTCDLKCKYSFKYHDSISTIKNIKKMYLMLSYEKINTYPVIFNSNPYYASDVFIFSPSLHTYSGMRADAEILIRHMSDYNNVLWVCIPLIKSNTVNKSTEILENIITNASKFANTAGSTTYLKKSINLNHFIPPNKKFYSYKNCKNNENFIVFSKDDGAFVTIKEDQLNNLKKIIGDYTTVIKISKGIDFYVNNQGPQSLAGDVTGDIYIDCKPVNDDGKMIEDSPPKMSSLEEMFSPESMKKFKESNAFKILIAFLSLIGIFILYKIIMKILDNFFGVEGESDSTPNSTSGNTTSGTTKEGGPVETSE
jgi:carbonic anhydrase